MYISYGKKN